MPIIFNIWRFSSIVALSVSQPQPRVDYCILHHKQAFAHHQTGCTIFNWCLLCLSHYHKPWLSIYKWPWIWIVTHSKRGSTAYLSLGGACKCCHTFQSHITIQLFINHSGLQIALNWGRRRVGGHVKLRK